MLIPRRGRDKDDPKAEEASESDLARRVLAHASSPEEKLEQLLAARSRELEEQARRFEEVMGDLERREALLRDMRASVERLLRLGTKDLTEREVELQELGREFMEREARLSAEEAELNRRRSELGAVELKREAVEQRERALAAREQELAAAAAPESGPSASGGTPEPPLRRGPFRGRGRRGDAALRPRCRLQARRGGPAIPVARCARRDRRRALRGLAHRSCASTR